MARSATLRAHRDPWPPALAPSQRRSRLSTGRPDGRAVTSHHHQGACGYHTRRSSGKRGSGAARSGRSGSGRQRAPADIFGAHSGSRIHTPGRRNYSRSASTRSRLREWARFGTLGERNAHSGSSSGLPAFDKTDPMTALTALTALTARAQGRVQVTSRSK